MKEMRKTTTPDNGPSGIFNRNTTTLAPEGYMYSEVLNNLFDHIPLPKIFLSTQERVLGKDSLGSSKSCLFYFPGVTTHCGCIFTAR